MASYPGSKVHRPSRRKLGRGQSLQRAQATVAPVATLANVALTFDRPVVVSGTIELNVSTGIEMLSQTQISPTVVHQVYASSVVGKTWRIDESAPVRTFQGGALAAASGTF